jgi:MscS family membrane protein
MSHRRINETIGLRYDDIGKIERVVEDIRAMMGAHPEIDHTQSMIVNFVKFNDFSLDITVHAFTDTTVNAEFHRVRQEILLKIAEIIARHGAEIAFPTRVNLVQSMPSGMPAVAPDASGVAQAQGT